MNVTLSGISRQPLGFEYLQTALKPKNSFFFTERPENQPVHLPTLIDAHQTGDKTSGYCIILNSVLDPAGAHGAVRSHQDGRLVRSTSSWPGREKVEHRSDFEHIRDAIKDLFLPRTKLPVISEARYDRTDEPVF